MRETKFRGKRIDNGEWVYGAFVENTTDCKYILPVVDAEFNNLNDSLIIVDPKTVGQFTGLQDIYGGDVVHIAGYGNYICKFPFTELYEAIAEGDIGDKIGNIHDNPELLNNK